MSEQAFKDQMKRLRLRFGDKNFDNEFVLLVWREVNTMSEVGFQRLCDVLIGSRSHNKPPLLSDFREARLREERIRFDNEVRGASRAMDAHAQGGLKAFMAKAYPGAKSLNEAVEIQVLRNRIAQANGNNDDGGESA